MEENEKIYKVGAKILKLFDRGVRPDSPGCSSCPWVNSEEYHCVQDLIKDYLNKGETHPLV